MSSRFGSSEVGTAEEVATEVFGLAGGCTNSNIRIGSIASRPDVGSRRKIDPKPPFGSLRAVFWFVSECESQGNSHPSYRGGSGITTSYLSKCESGERRATYMRSLKCGTENP